MQNFRIDAHYGCWFCGSMLFFVCIILTSRTLRSGGISMRCTSCGAELPEGTTFCTSCGAKVENAQPIQPAYDQNFQNQSYQSQNYQNQSFQQPGGTYTGYNQPYQQPMQSFTPAVMEDTTPITPLGYIGYNILFSIPLVGLIMLFVYGFGSNTNINVKNYARSFLIIYLAIVIIYVLIFLIFGAAIFGASQS